MKRSTQRMRLPMRIRTAGTGVSPLGPARSCPAGVMRIWDFFENLDSIRRAQHRVISKDLKSEVDKLIMTVNQDTLQVNINRINIKYNHSNWGSCSSNGNINISSRLLFAPMWVIESVIKHELAHFKEMNHSSRFWNIIEAIDQKHKQANIWLKANSWHCDF